MMRPDQDLRAQNDADLFRQLLEEPGIKRSIDRMERTINKSETRRQLLSTSVRLNPELAPTLYRVMESCIELLSVEMAVELFVYPSAQLNAACVRPEDGKVFLLFSSELLETLDEPELAFVAGHELGHLIFKHHDIPVGALLRTKGAVSPRTALQLFAWSRYAEISADRAGAYCAKNLDAVARSLFKLASGLKSGASHVVMDTLLSQVEEIESFGVATADDQPRSDWFSTHPFSPLRLKAAKLFSESDVMKDGGTSRSELESKVHSLMSLMEPGYLQDKSDQAVVMRRLLLTGAMIVADASNGVSETELEAIEGFLGEGKLPRHLDVQALKRVLPDRIEAVVEAAPPSRRAQVLRDLCVIARADGQVDAAERGILDDIAKGLDLDPTLVEVAITAEADLD